MLRFINEHGGAAADGRTIAELGRQNGNSGQMI
jgi:hypothetical protein